LPTKQQADAGIIKIEPEDLAGAEGPTEQAVGKEVTRFYPSGVSANRLAGMPFVDAAQMLPGIGRPFEIGTGDIENKGEEEPGEKIKG
jgi:hypothetical protein